MEPKYHGTSQGEFRERKGETVVLGSKEFIFRGKILYEGTPERMMHMPVCPSKATTACATQSLGNLPNMMCQELIH